jgi:squalene synthase HpnC
MRGHVAGGTDEVARAYLRARERAENFPVALRLLPGGTRRHLRNVYDVARTIDDLGDEAPGDRTAALLAFQADLVTIWRGAEPEAVVLRQLAASVRACDLPERPFTDLIAANIRDQSTTVYPTYDALLDYCELSANPIGRLVLAVFGVSTAERAALSDRVCTGLQIIEHCQDVAEDHRAGRIYLPLEDLARFGVTAIDFDASSVPARVRHLIEYEATRAEGLLRSGAPLLRQLHGWARLAVAGYLAGGRAAVAAMRRTGWAVLPAPPTRRRRDVASALIRSYGRPASPLPRGEIA